MKTKGSSDKEGALLSTTYAQWRKWILDANGPTPPAILERYPIFDMDVAAVSSSKAVSLCNFIVPMEITKIPHVQNVCEEECSQLKNIETGC